MPEFGARDPKRILRFLSLFWGALASAAILFPGAALLLNMPIVADSPLKGVYAATGTPFSALALLLVMGIGLTRSARDRIPRKCIRYFGTTAVLCFAIFFLVKTKWLNDRQWVGETWDPAVRYQRSKGVLTKTITSRAQDGVCIEHNSDGCVIEKSQEIETAELLALLLFDTTFVSLTVAFAVLGISLYLDSS